MLKTERGSSAVEVIFAMVVIMFLVLGVVEIAFSLYARNTMMAAAHEGSRAAAEMGRSSADARSIATETVKRSAGGLIEDLEVAVDSSDRGTVEVVTVVVRGRARSLGPVPFPMVFTARSTSSRETVP